MDALPLLAGLMMGAAVALLTLWVNERATGKRRALRARVAASDASDPPAVRSVLRRGPRRMSLAARLPLSAGAQDQMETELQRAGVPLRAGEYLAIRLASAVLGGVAGILLASRFGAALPIALGAGAALFVGGWVAPRLYVSTKRARRLDAIQRQVPDALDTLARSLRAGTGVVQALLYTAEETPPPLGPELALTMRELRLGANPEEAFTDLSERVGSADLDIAVTAIIIQRTVGGNLSEILTGVSHTIRERAKLYGEVKVLTSRQKLTGNLVALIPVLIALAFIGLNPEMGGLLVNTTVGRISLAIGLAFELMGLLMIRKFAQIEV